MAKTPPLIFEILEDPSNLQFLTLIEYKKVRYLTIIENIQGNDIQAYILDQLPAEGIDQEWFMSIATLWFYKSSDRYPLSFEFTKLGCSHIADKILKTFNVNSTARVVGQLFTYPTNEKPKIKRRKVHFIEETENIVF